MLPNRKKPMKQTVLFIILLLLCGFAQAADTDSDSTSNDEAKGTSGLPLPRFASLRSNEVNLRTGPGTRYPIDWVFVHQGVPVEITAEYEIWRRVRDSEGSEGWVHKTALSGKRTAIVTGTKPHDFYRHDDAQSEILAHIDSGAIGQLLSCSKDWCRLKFNNIKGYLHKADVWGAYPNEVFD